MDIITEALAGPFQYSFMVRALIVAVIVGVMCPVAGVYVVTRGLGFMSDGLAHSVLPGIVAAAILGSVAASVFVGGIPTAILMALVSGYLIKRAGIGEDASVGILFAALFAIGIIMISVAVSQGVSVQVTIEDMLLGNVLGVSRLELYITLGVAAAVLLTLYGLHKELMFSNFDPYGRRGSGPADGKAGIPALGAPVNGGGDCSPGGGHHPGHIHAHHPGGGGFAAHPQLHRGDDDGGPDRCCVRRRRAVSFLSLQPAVRPGHGAGGFQLLHPLCGLEAERGRDSATPEGLTMYDLNGKIAIVTGAGGRHGIGRAIATRLASEGANVVVTDVPASLDAIRAEDRQEGWEGLNSVAAEIEAMGRESLAIFSDVSDAGQVDDMVGQTLAKFGRIDILVNNAGSRPGKDRVLVVELEEEAFDEVMRVNVRGTYLVSRAVARHMAARSGGGKIINISSGAGKRGIARYAAYCASKFAVIGFTQALAQEMAQHRVNVNAICPGLVDTERVDFIAAALAPEGESSEEYRAGMIADRVRVPMGRVAQGDDIARMAAFLSSAESDYVTGLSISVSGGSEMN